MNLDYNRKSLAKIKGLIFDKDGLLVDSEKMVQRSWNQAGAMLGYGELFGNHIYNTIGFNVQRREQYFRENVDSEFPMQEFGKIAKQGFLDIEAREGIPLKKGAKELIQYAKAEGYKIGVATSSSKEHSTRVLIDNGIFELLDGAIFGDMVTHSKPNPEIYIKICELLDLKPEECIALEDSPAGIYSAKAAGLITVMVPDLVEPAEETLLQVDYLKSDLLEVIELLSR